MRDLPIARHGAAIAALTAAGVLLAATPSPGQTVEEVTVVGKYDAQGRAQQLSQAVSYRDLDITTKGGQATLRGRIETTAKDLCKKLGEPDRGPGDNVIPACQDSAFRRAMADMRTAVANAKPRPPGWTPPAQ